MTKNLSSPARSDSQRSENVSKLILTLLDMTRSVAEQKHEVPLQYVNFNTLAQSIRDSKCYPEEMLVKSNLLAYHLKKLREKGWIKKREALSQYSITEKGRNALFDMPQYTLKEILIKIDNWKRGIIGQILDTQPGADEIAITIEKLSVSMKNLFVLEQNANDSAFELWNALEQLSQGAGFQGMQTSDSYFDVLLEELNQISQEIDERGDLEYPEEIIQILVNFIQQLQETFREYRQADNLSPLTAKMGDALRRTLDSIKSHSPPSKESRPGFFSRFFGSKEDHE